MPRPKAGPEGKFGKLELRTDAALDAMIAKVLKLEPDISKSQHARIAVRRYCEEIIARHKAKKG
jgi:hypothetical protein